MLNHDLNAVEAGSRAGYPGSSRFSRGFKALFGATPRAAVQSLRNPRVTAVTQERG